MPKTFAGMYDAHKQCDKLSLSLGDSNGRLEIAAKI